MGNLGPEDVGYYGKPLSSLSKDELLKAALELAEKIYNCPAQGNCREVLELIKKQ
jgi:hypothetical protein